jgi:hypothetical protein
MLDRIFLRQFDNAYRGHRLAIWLLVLVVLVKAAQGANAVINPHLVMTTADGIPVDSFNAAGAEAAIALFALLGLYILILPLVSAVVLIRYRTMIPFMYLMLLIVQVGSLGLRFAHPIARSGAYHAMPIRMYVNLGLLAMMVIGFVLSLLRAGSRNQSLEGAQI